MEVSLYKEDMMQKKLTGYIVLTLSLLAISVNIQLAKITYYIYLATPVADFNKTEMDFISIPALWTFFLCILFSFYLIFFRNKKQTGGNQL